MAGRRRTSTGSPSTVNDEPDSEVVVEGPMVEAALRRAPVLAVGAESKDMDHELQRRVQELRRRYPDVHVYPVATDDGIGRFLEDNRERVQLVVIGSSDAGQLARVVGPHGHPVIGTPVFGSSGSSALSLEEAVVDDAESGLQVLVGLVEIGRELANVVVQ